MKSTLVVFLILGTTSGLLFRLPPKHKNECFAMPTIRASGSIMGSFDVAGIKEGLRTYVKHPTSESIVWESQAHDGAFNVTSDTIGQYRLCFDSMSSYAQTVGFSYHVRNETLPGLGGASHTHGMVTRDQTEKVFDMAGGLEAKLSDMRKKLGYAMTREEIYRSRISSINTRVIFFTFALVAVLIFLIAMQVRKVKQHFEVILAL